MNRYTLLYYIALPLLLLSSCAEDTGTESVGQGSPLPITIEATYPTQATTRASLENGFVEGDAVGIFVVDYDAEGNAGTPALKGDRAGNIRFTYDGSRWSANYQLYWKNSVTPADFYGYYPYDQQMESVTDYAFAVSQDQGDDSSSASSVSGGSAAGTSGYLQSDLLWAKAGKVMPTTDAIALNYRHLMAGLSIQLEQGTGFTADEWASLDKTVLVENTILSGTVNLQTGQTTVAETASAKAITPLSLGEGQGVRLCVFPQTVAAGKTLVSVTIDGRSYPLTKSEATTYYSGKMHNMTITVNRSEATGDYSLSLKADDIVAWIDDPSLHDGLTYAYTTVNVAEAGTLKEAIDALNSDYSDITSLKIAGPLSNADLDFIRDNLRGLKNVNMAKVELVDGTMYGFDGHSVLQHLVFPEKGMKYIGYAAFANTGLSGPIVIPEGVIGISQAAYAGTKVYGTVTLPSTLKWMENFTGHTDRRLTGELILPEGIEKVEAIEGDFTGTLRFPASVKEVKGTFSYQKMTGTVVIPRCMTEVTGFGYGGGYLRGLGCTQVEFHDGITRFLAGAFFRSNLSGELVLPPNCVKIGDNCFAETYISHIVFSDRLRVIDNGAFANCTYLTGTQRFAENVARVSAGCFSGCTALTGIVLPRNVELIEDNAFRNCYSLGSIVCENPEPPVVRGNAFLGVPKDNFTVEVPRGSVEKYREAEGWKEFKRISEYSNFVCRPMQACALNTAHTEQLVLNADAAWQVERKPDWVTVSPSAGTGKTALTLTFKEMAHNAGNRQDSIIFTSTSEGSPVRTFCVVSQYDYEYGEDSYVALQEHSRGRGIDIVFLGDGYDGEDISNGNYLSLVREQTEHFFDLEPYKSHRDFFNVYVAFPLSQEKGVNTMNTYVNNHFGTLYGYDGQMCTSNQLLTELADVRSYAVEHTPLTQDGLGRSLIILVPNSDAYEGVTYFEWYGSPVSICPPSSRPYPQDTRGVIQHEAGGHGFGRLGDEEIIYSAWAPSSVKGVIESKHRSGEYANLSTTSGLHSVPWADMVFDTRYSDQVDVYEGGLGYMRGVFRPEQNSCMNYGIPYYNAPSRLSIMRRIFDYAGVYFDMEYFYAHDSNAWGSTGESRQTRAAGAQEAYSGSSYAGSNQHRTPQTVDGKAMGDKVRKIREMIKNKNR